MDLKSGQLSCCVNGLPERAAKLLDSMAECLNLRFQIIKMLRELLKDKTMMVRNVAFKSQAELWYFPPELPSCKVGPSLRNSFFP